MATHVREVMTQNPIIMDTNRTIAEAARAMRDADVGAIVVRKDGGDFGIVTDRDLVVRGLAEGCDPQTTKLQQVYSGHLTKASPEDSVDQIVEMMRQKAIRRVPVVEGDKVVGIVSLGDLAIERDPNSALGQISAAPANT